MKSSNGNLKQCPENSTGITEDVLNPNDISFMTER